MASERPYIEFEGAGRKPKVTISKTWKLLRIGNLILLGIVIVVWAISKIA